MRKTLVLNCLTSEMEKCTVKPGQVCTAARMHRTEDISVRTQVRENEVQQQ